MPAAVAEEQHDPEAASEQVREGDEIGRAKTRARAERRKDKMKRRKDQRLRIGNLRPAGEHVRSPERLFAARERGRKELQFGLELRLRIPRDGDRARKPGP